MEEYSGINWDSWKLYPRNKNVVPIVESDLIKTRLKSEKSSLDLKDLASIIRKIVLTGKMV